MICPTSSSVIAITAPQHPFCPISSAKTFTDQGYRVARNHPYAGGFITEHYGQPRQNIHALQIEINRALYMDEEQIAPSKGWTKLLQHINYIIEKFQEFDIAQIRREN